MANYQLGAFVDAIPKRFDSFRLLSDVEYEEYKEATGLISSLLSDYQQFAMVRNSYADYKRLIDYYSQKYSADPRINDVLAGEMNHAVNRSLRTFFTEFRFFLDYAERKLKRQYGKDSEQVKEYKRAKSEQFDNSFAYRFVYQLRSYAQHINLPINALSLQSGEFDLRTATTKQNLLIETNRDDLLSSGFDWRAGDVRPQLRTLPSKFELNGYIEEMMECLEKIHVALVCISLPDAKKGALYIMNVAEPLRGRGTPCVYYLENTPEHPVENEVYNIVSKVSWIPVHLAAFVVDLPGTEVLSQYSRLEFNFKVQPN